MHQGASAAAKTSVPARSSLLTRKLRTRDGVALIVSNVVGVGIFTTPAIIARLVPHPGMMIALWIVGGLLALAGAMSYAELARLFPWAGGEYVYLSRIYGRTAGFLSGWTSLIAGFTGALAASAVGLVTYLGEYTPALASDGVLVQFAFITISPRVLTAAVIIIIFALLHSFTTALGRITQNSLALLITVVIAIFAGCGLAFGHGSWSDFHPGTIALHPINFLLALIPIMFTYSGWNAAAYVSEELHDTHKSIGKALFLGTMTVVALYTVVNVAYLYAVPVSRMTGAINVGDVAAQALFGTARNFVTPILVVALLGSISAMTIAGPRVYFSMARDGAFIPHFARTDRRHGTPALAIGLQALWSVALVCCAGFEQILMYTGFAIVLSSGVAVAGLFKVHRERLKQDRRLRLRMIIPALFVIASGAITVNLVVQSPRTALVGAVLIAAGLPVLYVMRRMSARRGFAPFDIGGEQGDSLQPDVAPAD